ncbi:MAG TPA: hypothetical protein VKC51_07520 [Lacunisphaera sp.]|nr:hypothetical protein [Lacunisphaera sp.]
MPSSISSFERAIPGLPWRRLTVIVALLALGASVAWEIRARASGYAPTLNDTSDLWADWREKVQPDSTVIIGDSRALFDTDLDTLEQGLGQRPVQLSLVGSCAYVVLENLANDESFHGTVISSLIPLMWLAPPPSPPYQNSLKALKRYQSRTVAQRASHHLGMFLEEHIAFLKQEDLTLEELLKQVEIPERAGFHTPPHLPPYFQTTERDRRTRMAEAAAKPGLLQERVKNTWLPLFTPPPPPSYVPRDVFLKGVGEAVEARFKDTAAAVKKLRARGGKVVFVRFPVVGELKKLEDAATPRAGPWTRILKDTGAPGIYFEDYQELAGFNCPEWSHLSGPDSVEFTKRLVPHLQRALGR